MVPTPGRAVAPGETFGTRVAFDAASIRSFATLCGDLNPLHHDEAAASRSPFGALIASGPHVTSLMMGQTATHFSQRLAPLGLEFRFRFVRAVPAGAVLDLGWTVTALAHKPSLAGDIVTLDGRAVDDDGVVYVTGHATLLLRPRSTA